MNAQLTDGLRAVPSHKGRCWDVCDWFEGDTLLFEERTYLPHNVFSKAHSEQWLPLSLPLAECRFWAEKYGGEACEDFYCEGMFFPRFTDFEKAVAFARSEDFKRLSKEKLPS